MSAKRRLPLNEPQPGLNRAFASLESTGLPEGPAAPPAPAVAPAVKRGRVVLRRETSGRGGKTVVVLDDFATHLTLPFLEALSRRLRAACGCGGTLKGRKIEIQGEQVSRIRELLEGEGFAVAGVR